jgi:hypothetical protein
MFKRWFKKRYLRYPAFVVSLCFFAVMAYAGVTDLDSIRLNTSSDDTYQIEVQNRSGTRVFSVDNTGYTYSGLGKTLELPLSSFLVSGTSSMTGYTYPYTSYNRGQLAIVYGYGRITPVVTAFRVPADYKSGGVFRMLVAETATNISTPAEVCFEAFYNRSGKAVDTAGSTQRCVSAPKTTTTPGLITLTVATDFTSLQAGDIVAFKFWRRHGAATGPLYINAVDFFYY